MRAPRPGVWSEALAVFVALLALGQAWFANRPDVRAFDASPVPDGVLRVATWNVGHGLDRGGGGLADEQLQQVAAWLVRLGAHGVALQELSSVRQARELERLLREGTGDPWHVFARPAGGRLVGFAWLGALEERAEVPGVDRALLLGWRSSLGRKLSVAVLHANAFSAEQRNVEIGVTVEALERLRDSTASDAVLLLGDLNLDLGLGERGDLFTDDRHLDVESYNFATRSLLDVGVGTGPTARPDRRLDYALLGGSARVVQVGPWTEPALDGLDHHPLVVDLSWD